VRRVAGIDHHLVAASGTSWKSNIITLPSNQYGRIDMRWRLVHEPVGAQHAISSAASMLVGFVIGSGRVAGSAALAPGPEPRAAVGGLRRALSVLPHPGSVPGTDQFVVAADHRCHASSLCPRSPRSPPRAPGFPQRQVLLQFSPTHSESRPVHGQPADLLRQAFTGQHTGIA
jgi:hypothetical protein